MEFKRVIFKHVIFKQGMDGDAYYTVYTIPAGEYSEDLIEKEAASLDPLPPLCISEMDYEIYMRFIHNGHS